VHGHPVVILYCTELLYGHHFTCQLPAATSCCLIYWVNMRHSADCQHMLQSSSGKWKMIVVRWNNNCNNLHFFPRTPQSIEYCHSHVTSFCSCHLTDRIILQSIEVVPGSIMSLPSVVKTLKYSCLSMFYTTYDFHQISSAINFCHF